jgi:hypothetical protein
MLGTLCVALTIIALAIWMVALWLRRPSPSTDYIAEFNELAMQDSCDPSVDGRPLLNMAYDAAVQLPPSPDWPQYGQPFATGGNLSAVREFLKKNETALQYLRQSAAQPHLSAPLLIPDGGKSLCELAGTSRNTAHHKALLHAASARLRLDLFDGDRGTLLDNAATLSSCSRAYQRPKTLVDLLTHSACRAVYCNTVLGSLQSDLVSLEDLQAIQALGEQMSTVYTSIEQTCFTAERIYIMDYIQQVFTDDSKGNGRLSAGAYYLWEKHCFSLGWNLQPCSVLKALHHASSHPDRKATTTAAEHLITYNMRMIATRPWQLRQQNTSYSYECAKVVSGFPILNENVSSLDRCFTIYHRDRALEDATICVIAILRYKRTQGELPHSLQQLVTDGYIAQVPLDPFTGGQLIYRPCNSDFTLYSVGENFVDDGGVSNLGKDTSHGDDVFWPRFTPAQK